MLPDSPEPMPQLPRLGMPRSTFSSRAVAAVNVVNGQSGACYLRESEERAVNHLSTTFYSLFHRGPVTCEYREMGGWGERGPSNPRILVSPRFEEGTDHLLTDFTSLQHRKICQKYAGTYHVAESPLESSPPHSPSVESPKASDLAVYGAGGYRSRG